MLPAHLRELESRAVYIIREALYHYKKPACLWSTGKDSTTLLYLVTRERPDIPVIHIDTGYKFPEIYEFRDRIAKEWNLNLIVAKNPDAKATPFDLVPNARERCCHERKTLALKRCVEEHGFDALFVAIRRDEQGIRNKERHFSPRDKDWKWDYWDQPMEFGDLYQFEFPGASHVRVHPLLDWDIKDVWTYVKLKGLPVNPLYFKGYSSLGCQPCTAPTINPPPKTIDEIIQAMDRIAERSGRAQDKEDMYVMQKLRVLGYM